MDGGFQSKETIVWRSWTYPTAASKDALCRIVMAEGPKAQGPPTLLWLPKATLLCGTQVTRGRIDGGVGQLWAVGIRPYYRGERMGFNQKGFLFGAAKPSHKRQANLLPTWTRAMQALLHTWRKDIVSQTKTCSELPFLPIWKLLIQDTFLLYDLGNHF